MPLYKINHDTLVVAESSTQAAEKWIDEHCRFGEIETGHPPLILDGPTVHLLYGYYNKETEALVQKIHVRRIADNEQEAEG